MTWPLPPANRAPETRWYPSSTIVSVLWDFNTSTHVLAAEDISRTATHGRDGTFFFDLRKVFGSRISRPSLDQLGSPAANHPASSASGASINDRIEPVCKSIWTY